MIETNITPKQLMKLNPSIKTLKQAKKILHDIKTRPSVSLGHVIARFNKVVDRIVN